MLTNKAMTGTLGMLIVNAYLLSIITYAAPVWEYHLAAMHKRKLQGVLERRVRLPAKVPSRSLSRLLKRGLGVCSLDDTVR